MSFISNLVKNNFKKFKEQVIEDEEEYEDCEENEDSENNEEDINSELESIISKGDYDIEIYQKVINEEMVGYKFKN